MTEQAKKWSDQELLLKFLDALLQDGGLPLSLQWAHILIKESQFLADEIQAFQWLTDLLFSPLELTLEALIPRRYTEKPDALYQHGVLHLFAKHGERDAKRCARAHLTRTLVDLQPKALLLLSELVCRRSVAHSVHEFSGDVTLRVDLSEKAPLFYASPMALVMRAKMFQHVVLAMISLPLLTTTAHSWTVVEHFVWFVGKYTVSQCTSSPSTMPLWFHSLNQVFNETNWNAPRTFFTRIVKHVKCNSCSTCSELCQKLAL